MRGGLCRARSPRSILRGRMMTVALRSVHSMARSAPFSVQRNGGQRLDSVGGRFGPEKGLTMTSAPATSSNILQVLHLPRHKAGFAQRDSSSSTPSRFKPGVSSGSGARTLSAPASRRRTGTKAPRQARVSRLRSPGPPALGRKACGTATYHAAADKLRALSQMISVLTRVARGRRFFNQRPAGAGHGHGKLAVRLGHVRPLGGGAGAPPCPSLRDVRAGAGRQHLVHHIVRHGQHHVLRAGKRRPQAQAKFQGVICA